MKDVASGKTYLTKRTRSVAGPAFARVGIDINQLFTPRQIMMAWSRTLTDSQAESLLAHLMKHSGRAATGQDPSES